jgi:hypothetical protein
VNRLRNTEVVNGFLDGREVWPCGLWCNDRALFSYGQPVAYRDLDTQAGKLLVRLVDLPLGSSRTTVRHQRLVSQMAKQRGMCGLFGRDPRFEMDVLGDEELFRI